MTKKFYKVVWDEEYCGNCHDEVLAGSFKTQKEAGEWGYDWAMRKARQLLPTGSGKEIEILANAKFRELSIMEYEAEVKEDTINPKVKARIEYIRKVLDAYEKGERILYFDEVDRHGGYWRELPYDEKGIDDWFCEFTENYKLGVDE